jgi:hypothetical protein
MILYKANANELMSLQAQNKYCLLNKVSNNKKYYYPIMYIHLLTKRNRYLSSENAMTYMDNVFYLLPKLQ